MRRRLGPAAVAALAIAVSMSATAWAASYTWEGRWSSTFGTIEMTASGSGTYPNCGTISGGLSGDQGRTNKGTWQECSSNGKYEFHMSESGGSFTGTYTRGTSSTCVSPPCTWDGTCVAGPCIENTSSPCPGKEQTRAHTAAINEVRVVSFKGEPGFHKARAADDVWCEIEKDSVLKQGDEISCGPDDEVTLQFADNSTVVVKNTSQLKIASFFTEGGTVKTEILLKMGAVAAKVHKSEATKSDFRIKEPNGDALTVRGTTFSVFYDPGSKATLVSTTEGKVEVNPGGRGLETVIVPAGKQVEVTPKGVSNVAKIGNAGARGGLTRLEARNKVLRVVAKGDDPCGVTTPRTKAYSIGTVPKGWKMTVKLLGRNAGKSKWRVVRGKVKTANALAKKIKQGCS
jgi:FecR-like protein